MPERLKPFPTDRISNLLPPIDIYTHIPQTQYIYFEDSENHPFQYYASGFSIVNAWWLADAAMLAYSDVPVAEYWFRKAGFESFEWFRGKTTSCYVVTRRVYPNDDPLFRAAMQQVAEQQGRSAVSVGQEL